jgi:flagellar biosynthesis/type III secretory pathway protein FliH
LRELFFCPLFFCSIVFSRKMAGRKILKNFVYIVVTSNAEIAPHDRDKEELQMAVQEAFDLPAPKMDREALFVQQFLAEGIDLDVWFERAIQRAKEVEKEIEKEREARREEGMEEGIRIGEHKALFSMTLRLIQRLLGELDEATQEKIKALPNDKLEALSVALLGFASFDDLHKWLNDNSDEPRIE